METSYVSAARNRGLSRARLVVLGTLVLSAAALPQPVTTFLELDNIRIDDPAKAVFSRYGTPMDTARYADGTVAYSFWRDNRMTSYVTVEMLAGDSLHIWSVQLSAKDGMRLKGIDGASLGMPVDSLYARFGTPTTTKKLTRVPGEHLAYAALNCSFDVNKGRVNRIKIVSPMRAKSALPKESDAAQSESRDDGAVESQAADLESTVLEDAKKQGARHGSSRYAVFDIAPPTDEREYERLERSSVLMVVAIAHADAELPLKRAFVRTNGADMELVKVASVVTSVRDSVVAQALGSFRETAFFLVPLSKQTGASSLNIQWSKIKQPTNLGDLPAIVKEMPPFAMDTTEAGPQRDKVDMGAVKRFVKREFGVEIPEARK